MVSRKDKINYKILANDVRKIGLAFTAMMGQLKESIMVFVY